MANNATFILPQWLIPQEPGMKCESHKYILNMFVTYNIVSVVLSVALATPFFVSVTGGVKRVLLPWKWKCWKGNEASDDEETTVTGFVVSVLGSIAIALSAPLLAGNSIVKNHPDANRWVIIEQWSTRPRATIFVFIINMIAKSISDNDKNNFVPTACSTIVSEIVLSLFGIKFLWNQSSVSLQKFDPRLPCTEPLSDAGQIPLNCPAMQQGALFLGTAIIINSVLVALLLLCFPCVMRSEESSSSSRSRRRRRRDSDSGMCLLISIVFVGLIMIFAIYVGSWITWFNFLNNTPEELYCVEGSALVDLIYCLLPVALGLWRLLWAYGMGV